MKAVIKALNTALLNLTWWKKPILFILYPILLAGVWFVWRVEGKSKENSGSVEDGEY